MAADDVVELGNKGEQLTVTLCPTGNVGKAGSGIEHCLDSTETGVGTQDCLFFGGGGASFTLQRKCQFDCFDIVFQMRFLIVCHSRLTRLGLYR